MPPRLRDTLKTVRAEESTAALKRQVADLRAQLKFTVATLDRHRAAKAPPPRRRTARGRLKGDRIRICAADLHGAKQNPTAVAAFLADVKRINPHEIILGGDIVDCGGFLAQHHTMGYVAETAYSYEDDIAAASNFLDRLQGAAPRARIEYLEGNHERRVETWCVTQTLRHQKDAELLRRAVSPETLLRLKTRGIPYYRVSECYDRLDIPGIIHRGNVYFVHGITTAKHAAAVTLERTGANIVYFHSHRAQSDIQRRLHSGVIGAWNPGCLCEQQPLWNHGKPTNWTNGYAVQLTTRTGRFLHLNIPLIDGQSDFPALMNL
jgi:hypothetical protein